MYNIMINKVDLYMEVLLNMLHSQYIACIVYYLGIEPVYIQASSRKVCFRLVLSIQERLQNVLWAIFCPPKMGFFRAHLRLANLARAPSEDVPRALKERWISGGAGRWWRLRCRSPRRRLRAPRPTIRILHNHQVRLS